MIRSRLPQPSAKLATCLDFVALLVALGGTTYAALKRGIVKVGGGIGSIFSLPPGFRRASGTLLLSNAVCDGEPQECESDSNSDEEDSARLTIAGSNVNAGMGLTLNGTVLGAQGTVMALEGITFRAKS